MSHNHLGAAGFSFTGIAYENILYFKCHRKYFNGSATENILTEVPGTDQTEMNADTQITIVIWCRVFN